MEEIASKPGLKKFYKKRPQKVQTHFEHVLRLIEEDFPLEVCLAYVFFRLEYGQNAALYLGTVKVYNIDSTIAKKIVGAQHLTRDGFIEFYRKIFKTRVPEKAVLCLKEAEKTRDVIMHGKKANQKEVRNAIARVLEYAEIINEQLYKNCALEPFGYLTGVLGGRKNYLDKPTSKYVLKGIGFSCR